LVNNGGHRLQLIQQWWLPIVNGWCQPFAAHAMATTQQSPPLPFMWAIVLLLLQHMLAFCSFSKLTIPRAFLDKFPGTCQTFQSPESSKHPFADVAADWSLTLHADCA
jgi:hypothetical protein